MPQEPKDNLKSLQSELNFYKTLIANSRDWEYMIDNDNNCVYVSPSVKRITGYSPEDFYADKLLLNTLIHPEDQKSFYEHKHSQSADGMRSPIEFRIITRDKKVEWISHDCMDVHDESGQRIGIRGSNRLITDKKLMEERCHQLSKINRSVIDQAPIGIGAYATNGNCLSANPIFAEIIGTSLDKVLAQNYHRIESWKISGLYNEVQKALNKKEITEYELEVDSSFGKHVYLNCTIVPFDTDNNIEFLLLIEDISKRKIAEKELLLRKQTYKDLVQNAQSIILKVDRNANVSFFNEYAEHFFGYTAKEILGKNLVGTIVPEFDSDGNDLKKIITGIFTAESTADFLYYENENICKDGKRVWVAWRNKAFYNEQNEITEILCIGIDNTQKHRAELALIKEQEITKAILNATDESAFLIDKNAVFLEMNTTTAKRFNRSKKELMGECVYNLIPPEILDNRRNLINQVFKTNKQVTHVDERNGMILENRIYPVTNSKNEVYQAAIFSKDITEKNMAERKLLESEEKLSYFKDNNPGGILFIRFKKPMSLSLSLDQTIEWVKKYEYIADCNDAAAIDYGYKTKKDIIGKSTYNVLAQNDEALRNILSAHVKTRFARNRFETKEVDQHGKIKYFINSSFPIIEDNYLHGLNIIAVDITKKKELEEELEKLLAAKDKFISIISHDLRLPFNAMLGFSEVLLERIQSKEFNDLERIAQILKDTSENTFELLENLLMWGQTQRSNIEFNPQKYQLSDFLTTVCNQVMPTAISKQISLKLGETHKANVWADKTMVETVIRNLLSNAIKFTPNKGEVIISTQKEIGFVKLAISDNGQGMEQEKINRLFKIEYAESAPGTNGEKGTGLGLLLCKEFVEKNKGQIYVSSEQGLGSTFTVELPLHE